MILSLLQTMFASLLCTFAFGIIFNVRKERLIYASIIGMFAGLVWQLCVNLNFGFIVSQFFAAVTLSGLSEYFSRKIKTPVTTFIICSLIPLVPGGGMYLAMRAIMESNSELGNRILLETLEQSGALTLGIVVVSTISVLIKKRYKKK